MPDLVWIIRIVYNRQLTTLSNSPASSYNAGVMSSSSLEPPNFIEETVAIVGVGLIGGSIAAALKQRGLARRVIGVGRSRTRLEAACRLGLLDDATEDLAEAGRRANLLVFCTPVDRIVAGVRDAARACRPGTLITDAGSVKGPICRELETGLPPGIDFVGSHPLAGSEKQGFEAADPELFRGRVCVLTPLEQTPRIAVERVSRFWAALGAHTLEMTPRDHDHAVAETSHFPHVAAAALVAALSEDHRQLAASGFRDTTRIAGGDPDLWTSILIQNAAEVLSSLDKYARVLNAFRHALRVRSEEDLKRLLGDAKTSRDRLGYENSTGKLEP